MLPDSEEYDRCFRRRNAKERTFMRWKLGGAELQYIYADMAPPPLACPSILVTMMAPKLALSLNARLCDSAA